MTKLRYGRGYVYSLKYHIVWCVKYRKKILTDKISEKLKEILQDIAKENKFTILEMSTDKDHVHMLIECSPQHYIPSVMKALKGVSARKLFISYPELKTGLWGGHLWNPSYFAGTVSEHTEEMVKEYIKGQEEK
jgi:putative transposase